MPRTSRIVLPGIPHHVTQRGNRRQPTFFQKNDYCMYRALMADAIAEFEVQVWAYCFMPNHVHFIMVPETPEALGHVMRTVHMRYSRTINKRHDWTGHLWQGRFWSCPMDEPYTLMAARYIECNPVYANMVDAPHKHPWSSAAAHVKGIDDALVLARPLLDLVPDWRGFLSVPLSKENQKTLNRGQSTGRPLGTETFLKSVEAQTGRSLIKQKPGPKTN